MSRRSSHNLREQRTGALTYSATRSVPRTNLYADRQGALQSPYRTRAPSLASRLVHPEPRTRVQTRRFPSPSVSFRADRVSKFFPSELRPLLIGGRNENYCQRRLTRRRVLFATQRAGYPGSAPGANRKYRRTITSQFGCRR